MEDGGEGRQVRENEKIDGVENRQAKVSEKMEDGGERRQAREEQEDGGCSRKRSARGIEAKNTGLEGL